jgi:hypothetical protein
VSLGLDMPLPSILACRRLRCLTQTLREAWEQVGAPRSLVRVSVPPRIYASHVALISSIHETSSYSLEERCDALMEDVEIDFRVVAMGVLWSMELFYILIYNSPKG